MKIKVGNRWYSDQEEPILLLLTDNDRVNIARMGTGEKAYMTAPPDLFPSDAEVQAWIQDGLDYIKH